jgi:hypothetical protein
MLSSEQVNCQRRFSMKTVEKKVYVRTKDQDGKPGRKEVGTVRLSLPDTLAELQEVATPQEIVDLFNSQKLTNEMNALRAKASGKVPMKEIRDRAFRLITTPEMNEVLGDPVKFEALMDRKIEEAKAKIEAERTAEGNGEDDGDEDEDSKVPV